MRALYEWLAVRPGVALKLNNVVSQTNSDAALFVVIQDGVTRSALKRH